MWCTQVPVLEELTTYFFDSVTSCKYSAHFFRMTVQMLDGVFQELTTRYYISVLRTFFPTESGTKN